MIREIAIADCVHHCGFRYGRNEFNPYENYIIGLAEGRPLEELRYAFIDFICHYRPRDIGEALGIKTSKSIPLWLIPWKSWRKLFRPPAWQESTENLEDILTYFSPAGVEWRRIEEEFNFLERAFVNIRDYGYQPEQHGYIEVLELYTDKLSRFLVLDGNHRLSACYALGEKNIHVRQPMFYSVHRNRARFWPLVLSGHVPFCDALEIFDSYVHGNITPYRAINPARIIY